MMSRFTQHQVMSNEYGVVRGFTSSLMTHNSLLERPEGV
jgi:hypothetical protein